METMGKIDIRDLSIGDWVMYRDADANVRVSDIYSNGYVFIVGEEDSGISESVNAHHHVMPIPLTPEILEKNGLLREEESSDRIFYSNADMRLCTYDGVEWWRIEIYDYEEGMARVYSGLIDYVHQLQHALRLAGVEKEITI